MHRIVDEEDQVESLVAAFETHVGTLYRWALADQAAGNRSSMDGVGRGGRERDSVGIHHSLQAAEVVLGIR